MVALISATVALLFGKSKVYVFFCGGKIQRFKDFSYSIIQLL
jgi:hypothetical protein